MRNNKHINVDDQTHKILTKLRRTRRLASLGDVIAQVLEDYLKTNKK